MATSTPLPSSPDARLPVTALSVAARRLWQAGGPWRVLSVHARVVNLEDAAGHLLAIAHPQVGLGPFHMVVARPVTFAALRPGMPVSRQGDAPRLGPWVLDFDHAQKWDAHLPPLPSSVWEALWPRARELTRALLSASPWQAEVSELVAARIQEGLRTLQQGWEGGDVRAWQAGARLLAGLGPGLTPAGDDVLLGVMARLWLQRPPGPWTAEVACPMLWAQASPRTTHLSRTWLKYAAQGCLAQPWHHVRAALLTGNPSQLTSALTALAAMGATSGRFALLGACFLEDQPP